MAQFKTIELFDWIKRIPEGYIDLTLSGIQGPATLDDLGFKNIDLPISGNNLYGYKPLKDILAANYQVDPSRIAITPGASMANFAVATALAGEGDRVVIEHPAYQPFIRVAETVTGRKPERLVRDPEDDYSLNLKDSVFDSSFRFVQLTNLHNPTGIYAEPDVFIEMAERSARCDGWVVVDEVFLPFMDGGESRSAAQLHDRIISTCSLTKVWGLSGLRVGWIIGPPDLITRVEHIMDYLHVNQPFSTDFIAWMVLSDTTTNQNLLSAARKTGETNIKIVLDYIDKMPQLNYVAPSGGISILIRFKDKRDSEDFTDTLRDRFNTLVQPGKYFEVPDGFRLSFGMDESLLRSGLEAVKSVLDNIKRTT